MGKRREIVAVDCETDPFKYGRVPKPFIWGAYDGLDYHEFNSTNEFVEWAKPQRKIFYAHNGGKFDWHFIAHHIEGFEEITLINGRLSKFKIGEAEFRDSINIIPVPLGAYNKDAFDYRKLEADVRDHHMKEIRKYLQSDVFYLYDLISAYVSEYGINLTQAGTAVKVWQSLHGKKIDKSSASFYDHFFPYYYLSLIHI